MTRSELVQSLAQKFPQLTSKDAELAVAEIVDAIQRALTSGGRVEIRGFGSFGLNYRPPRTGRNPKTGKQVLVPGKYSPHFKAGKKLRERIAHSTTAAGGGCSAAEGGVTPFPTESQRASVSARRG